MKCLNCGTELIQSRLGRPKRYCSDKCRKKDMAYRKKNNLVSASKLNVYQLEKYQ